MLASPKFIFSTAAKCIFLPFEEEFKTIELDLTLENGEMKKVILYIDGSIEQITKPDNANDA